MYEIHNTCHLSAVPRWSGFRSCPLVGAECKTSGDAPYPSKARSPTRTRSYGFNGYFLCAL